MVSYPGAASADNISTKWFGFWVSQIGKAEYFHAGGLQGVNVAEPPDETASGAVCIQAEWGIRVTN